MKYDEDQLLLLTPGPVSLHPRVLRALSSPVRYHRSDEFSAALDWVSKSISAIEKTENVTIPLTGSGTAAMDAALSSLLHPNTRVLSFVNGAFSERMYDIARYYSREAKAYEKPWGTAITRDDVKKALDDGPYDVVTIVHNETSTAVVNPMGEIMDELRKSGAISVVDGITTVGGDVVEVDKWGVDVMITASQKCLGAPPGMSFLTVSERSLSIMRERERGNSYYLDARNYLKNGHVNIPFTTTTPILMAVEEALKMIEEEGIDSRIKRHRSMARTVREGIKAMGLQLLAETGYESNTVTAAFIPNANSVIAAAKRHGVLFAEGQGQLAGKILRFGHMNLVGEREALTGLAVLELALRETGIDVKRCDGIETAIEQFLAGQP